MYKQRLITAIATQLTSFFISAVIILADLDMDNTPEDAEAYGGTLTVMMIFVGLMAHFRSNREPVPLGMIALICVFAPAFAFASGPINNVAGYHILALGFHGLILRGQYKLEHKKPVEPHPAAEREDDGGSA